MKKTLRLSLISGLKNHRGVTVIVVALAIVMLIGFAALAVDLGYMMVAKNELQNAADAGALAGARYLYTFDYDTDGNITGGEVNKGANQIAIAAATANKSAGTAVEVNETDVQRGHWSFGRGGLDRGFYANNITLLFDFIGYSDAALDAEEDFINAIKVTTRRDTTPIASFFARIFGYGNFKLSAEAVAYIGFAGSLQPGEVDQPIAICKESILQNGLYSCNIGRMINSGGNDENSETGGWTDFNQEDNPCEGGTNATRVRALVCGEGNTEPIIFGKPMATNGGAISTAFQRLQTCWQTYKNTHELWNITLPVVECPGNNMGTCSNIVGVVNLNIVWITGAGTDPDYSEAPFVMGDWSNDNTDGEARWNSFVAHFYLKAKNDEGELVPAPYQNKTIYFLPDCTVHEPTGNSGGENFGIRAKIPVLVK